MAVLFATNRLVGLLASTNISTEVTTAGRFDAAYVSSGISVSGGSNGSQFVRATLEANQTSVWFHFDVFYTAFAANGSSFVNIRNDALTPVIRLTWAGSSQIRIQYWNGSAYVDGPAFAFAASALATVDVEIVCGASGLVRVYFGNALVSEVIGLNAAVNHVRHFEVVGEASNVTVSQLIIADQETRSWKLSSDVANANGANNAGTGSFSDVDNNPVNFATARVITANGDKFTMPHAARTFPAGMQAEAVVVNGMVRANGGVVTNARAVLRIGGVDYNSSLVVPVPASGYEPRRAIWAVNPATLVRFTQAAYNGLEFGWEART